MIKWSLLVSTIPYVIVSIIIRYFLYSFIGFKGIIDFSDIILILTGGIFLVGIMLRGTLADYKESEKFPAELACLYESIEDSINLTFKNLKIKKNRNEYLETLLSSITDIKKWLHKSINHNDLYSSLENFSYKFIISEKDGFSIHTISKILSDINSIRKIVARIDVISRTGFLLTGYALLEVLISSIIFLLMITVFKNEIAEKVLTSFVIIIYVYMYKLIKDIDDPFEYSPDGTVGASEIPLFPIDEYIQRLKDKLQRK